MTPSRFKLTDLSRVKTISISRRKSKADIHSFGQVCSSGDAEKFFRSLPGYLKSADLVEFIMRVKKARQHKFPFHVMMGAHVLKVGLSSIIIDLMRKGIVTGLSFNSAGLIHDLELAFSGKTSEDVAVGLKDGSFGMAEETGRHFAEVVNLAENESLGLGEAAGKYINNKRARYRQYSLFAEADRLGLPATVHIVIGTDIVQQLPNFNPGMAAEASYRDFKILSNLVIDVDRGGVIANIGSAVVLPEVFLKALTVARNLHKHTSRLTTANFDMILQYRPALNVVQRPVEAGGKGFNFVGHHEIMIPLLAWGLKGYIGSLK